MKELSKEIQQEIDKWCDNYIKQNGVSPRYGEVLYKVREIKSKLKENEQTMKYFLVTMKLFNTEYKIQCMGIDRNDIQDFLDLCTLGDIVKVQEVNSQLLKEISMIMHCRIADIEFIEYDDSIQHNENESYFKIKNMNQKYKAYHCDDFIFSIKEIKED